jgi:regulator of sirC expression with transglutaminase-like and TPR domain
MQYQDFRKLFTQQIQLPDAEMELDRAVLYLAGEDYPALEAEDYLQRLASLASEVLKKVGDTTDQRGLMLALNHYLFDELGFTGNAADYYNPDNSYLNRVLETRMGIPITLSVLYLEVGRRLGLVCHGVGLPGHFVVGLDILGLYLDPFHAGQLMSATDCRLLLQDMFGDRLPWREEFLRPYSKHEILLRMLTNLSQIFMQAEEYARAVSVIQRMTLINPAMPSLYKEMSWCHLQLKEYRLAIGDLETYLQREEAPQDAEEVQHQIQVLRSMLSQLN